MANRNTTYARSQGFSSMSVMDAKKDKDYGQKTGQCLNTSKLREAHGKKKWRGEKPA